MKRIISLLLMLIMAFALAIPATASEVPEPSPADYTVLNAAISAVNEAIADMTEIQKAIFWQDNEHLKSIIDSIDYNRMEDEQAVIDEWTFAINAELKRIEESVGRWENVYVPPITTGGVKPGYNMHDHPINIATRANDPYLEAMGYLLGTNIKTLGIGHRVDASLTGYHAGYFELHGVRSHYVWGDDWPRYTILPKGGLPANMFGYEVWLTLQIRIPPFYAFVWETIHIPIYFNVEPFYVNFYDYDGAHLGTRHINTYGGSAEAFAPKNDLIGWRFTGWDSSFSSVTSDMNVKAVYAINEYEVNFYDHDGTLINKQIVKHGSAAVFPEEPVRTGYMFAGWDPVVPRTIGENISKHGDVFKYTATYQLTVIKTVEVTSFNANLQGGNNSNLTFTVRVTMNDGRVNMTDGSVRTPNPTVYILNHAEKVNAGQKGSRIFVYPNYAINAVWNDNNKVTSVTVNAVHCQIIAGIVQPGTPITIPAAVPIGSENGNNQGGGKGNGNQQ